MNVKLFLLGAFACCSMCFMACDDDDNHYRPDNLIEKAFETKYPNAQHTSWESKNGYKVAEFQNGSYEAEAWFDSNGEWVMTETDIPYNALPQEIKNHFESSPYAQWKVEDIDMLERKDTGTIYIIEVEQGNQEIDLHYTPEGILIKEVADSDNHNGYQPSVIPNNVKDLIAEMYPGAVILEIENEKGGKEVDILHNNIHKEVLFDANNNWVYTTWEIRQNDVPGNVMEVLNNSAYASYRIDDIDVIEKPDSDLLYVFELEQGKKEIRLTITAAGTIVQ